MVYHSNKTKIGQYDNAYKTMSKKQWTYLFHNLVLKYGRLTGEQQRTTKVPIKVAGGRLAQAAVKIWSDRLDLDFAG